jgi:hypothetical protein
METITQKGYLEKFAIIYLDRMKKLNYTKQEAINFFEAQHEHNIKNNIVNNLFDMIAEATKLKQN